MEKTKKETIEHSDVHKGSPMEGVGVYMFDIERI